MLINNYWMRLSVISRIIKAEVGVTFFKAKVQGTRACVYQDPFDRKKHLGK